MSSANPAQFQLDDSKINRGTIAILLGTRGRPEKLVEVFDSLRLTTAQKDRIAMWLYVDDDDHRTRAAIDAKSLPDPGFPVHFHIGPSPQEWDYPYKHLWTLSGRTAEIYMIANDDVRFDTRGWDDVVRDHFKAYPDGVVLACPWDPVAPEIATFPIIGWGWFQTLQGIYSGYFFYWFEDKWVDEIGRMIGRYINIPILLSPIRGKGRTQRMRCLPFWTRFFQLSLPIRKEAAIRLINAMHPHDEKARAAALAKMEEVAASFEKDAARFSDVYHVFQEERHTAMSPEERDRFTPLYFKQEVHVVTRLLAFAQAHLDKQEYADALKYIEATQMADFRVRQAQEMKAQCLRALGRNREADDVEREAVLAWPRMGFLRRLFRFLGKVANEAKSLLVGMVSGGKRDPNRKLGG
jgi:hypothetical protein